MGLIDRDYMHERHKRSKATFSWNTNSISNKALKGISHWKIAVIFLAILGALFFGFKHRLKSKYMVPFPPTGAVQWYRSISPDQTAALTISAPANKQEHFIVRLDDWESKAPVALIPIRSGERISTEVPFGRYRLTIASGKVWQGSEKLFGTSGEVKVAVSPFEFYKVGNQTMGHQIDLTNRLNGNLQTRPAGLF